MRSPFLFFSPYFFFFVLFILLTILYRFLQMTAVAAKGAIGQDNAAIKDMHLFLVLRYSSLSLPVCISVPKLAYRYV